MTVVLLQGCRADVPRSPSPFPHEPAADTVSSDSHDAHKDGAEESEFALGIPVGFDGSASEPSDTSPSASTSSYGASDDDCPLALSVSVRILPPHAHPRPLSRRRPDSLIVIHPPASPFATARPDAHRPWLPPPPPRPRTPRSPCSPRTPRARVHAHALDRTAAPAAPGPSSAAPAHSQPAPAHAYGDAHAQTHGRRPAPTVTRRRSAPALRAAIVPITSSPLACRADLSPRPKMRRPSFDDLRRSVTDMFADEPAHVYPHSRGLQARLQSPIEAAARALSPIRGLRRAMSLGSRRRLGAMAPYDERDERQGRGARPRADLQVHHHVMGVAQERRPDNAVQALAVRALPAPAHPGPSFGLAHRPTPSGPSSPSTDRLGLSDLDADAAVDDLDGLEADSDASGMHWGIFDAAFLGLAPHRPARPLSVVSEASVVGPPGTVAAWPWGQRRSAQAAGAARRPEAAAERDQTRTDRDAHAHAHSAHITPSSATPPFDTSSVAQTASDWHDHRRPEASRPSRPQFRASLFGPPALPLPPLPRVEPESPTLPAFCVLPCPDNIDATIDSLAHAFRNSPSPLLSTPCTPDSGAHHRLDAKKDGKRERGRADGEQQTKARAAPTTPGAVATPAVSASPLALFAKDAGANASSPHSSSSPPAPAQPPAFLLPALPIDPSSTPTEAVPLASASPQGSVQDASRLRQEEDGHMSDTVDGLYCQDTLHSHPPLVQPAVPPLHPFHQHKPRPSVPFSPHSSARSDEFAGLVASPSAKYRFSKLTVASTASTNSSESASAQPSFDRFAAVPEETESPPSSTDEHDASLDLVFDAGSTTPLRPHRGAKDPFSSPGDYDPVGASPYASRSRAPLTPSTPDNYTQVPASSTTRTRTNRAPTVSSQHSARPSATRTAHPFASPSTPPPPPPSLAERAGFLSPQHRREAFSPPLPSSRSFPDLSARYDMTMVAPAHQLVVSADDEHVDGETCPVCCESLSFTFRLPGEKPHIVPECGHALHEECFVTVYGDVPPEGSRRNLGVCGMCRQQMRIGGGERRGTGKNSQVSSSPMSQPSSSGRNGFSPSSPDPADPTVDDPLESSAMAHSTSSRSLSSDVKLVVPSIAIKSEFPSVRRNKGGKQVITAMVTVYVPQAPDRSRYPPARRSEATPTASSTDASSPQFPPSPRSASSYPEPAIMPSSARSQPTPTTSASFAHVVADLRNRVIDYKTSGLDTLGPLRLFDLLSVRKGQLVREFHVYLFQDAIICISEERKSGLRGIFSSSSSVRSGDSSSSKGGAVLKLKGRIYVRHIRQVVDTSVAGELSLTITMEDESMDSFILTFKDRGAHETWKQTVQRLIDEMRDPTALAHAMQSANKVAKLTGTAVPIPRIPASASSTSSRPFSPSHSNGGQPHHIISNSFGDLSSGQSTPASPTLKIDRPLQIATGGPGDLALHAPLAPVHTPLDLVLVLSLPAPSPSPSASLPLKIRLIRSSVQFVLACMGPRDRVSLVATELGPTGTVRKTPLLNATHVQSRARLEAFVETLGVGKIPRDEFEIGVSSDERRDVITAVNVALDVVLQRKAKNPLTGVVLISDTSDVIRRAQMDLVTARLDAANVPVHALGYGKSHDPSPLWMMSNHTHGTYTFVKEWYHLRDSLAGVLGGLMSIAMTNMKLHVSAQDNEFRVTKVSGTSQAVVAASGKNVDIELRELRHGERREILIELEIDNGAEEQRLSTDSSAESGATPDSGSHEQTSSLSAASMRKSPSVNTDRLRGINGLAALGGFDRMSINDGLRDVAYGDAIIDEVPVAEVDCAFHDPAVGKSAARLAHPVLLTLPILPPTAQPTSAPADPAIVRRRMELLASDMITRALLIASRKNYSQATRILRETKRIIESVANGMRGTLPPLPPSHAGTSIASGHTQHTQASTGKSRREVQTLLAIEGLVATVQDVDQLLDGLDVNKDMFERDHRNYAAQQAIILRAQRSWTTRTPTEMEYATRDVQYLIQLSGEYSART